MRRRRETVLGSHLVLGTVTILVVGLAVYLSYIAENGLPFIPTYRVNLQVANADELSKNADVRVGGARVGQILSITAEPPSKSWPHPYAQLGLALDASMRGLPKDSRYRIRLASVLGAKYLELIVGHPGRGKLPDGGTLRLARRPAMNHELPFVDLDTALRTFGPTMRSALRAVLRDYGNAVAGRGSQLNHATSTLNQVLEPLQRVLAVFATPGNRFGELISGAAATTQALAGVAPTITSLLDSSATTFGALHRRALGTTIDRLPGTESVASRVLTRALPTLREAAALTAALRPAARLLPTAATRLDAIITAAPPVFRPLPRLAGELEAAVASVRALAVDPASALTFKALGRNDLATVGSSGFIGLGAILRAAAPAQFACNVTGLWLRNFASGLTEGDSTGPWLRVMPLFDPKQSNQVAKPSGDLHDNFYPLENTAQCSSGNERYSGSQLIGSPPRTSTVVDNTSPPRGVLAEGRKAGLVP
ncbi:MAG: MlaD family protein [Solirubrobacteraceae bacterium]